MAIPDNRNDLEAMGYKFNGEGVCRYCDVDLFWFTTPRGKKMPMNLRSESESTASPGTLQPHWEICPGAKEARKPR